MTLERPKGWSKRDVLCGIIAAAGSHLKIPCALDVAAKVCEPLWTGQRLDVDWFPAINSAHAQAAIAYATRCFLVGQITKDEYEFVTEKARRAIIRGLPSRQMEFDHGKAENPVVCYFHADR